MNRKSRRKQAREQRRAAGPGEMPPPKAVISLASNCAEAENDLDTILRESGDLDGAINTYRKAVLLQPQNPHYQANLGVALLAAETNSGCGFQDSNQRDEALAALHRSATLAPNHTDFQETLATVLSTYGRNEMAISVLEQAISIQPDNPPLHAAKADILMEMGRLAEASLSCRRALSLDPTFAKPYFILATIDAAQVTDAEMEAMLEVLAKPSIPRADAVSLNFALARIHDARREYPKAFELFSTGNRLMRPIAKFDRDKEKARFERVQKTFSAEFLEESPTGCDTTVPIFIVGMPRSGSTLVEQILSAHSNVHGGGELVDMKRLVGQLGLIDNKPDGFPEVVTSLSADKLRLLGEEYLRAVRMYNSDTEHITDKLPANFLFIGFIRKILPHAKIIHCRRNAVATCWSCFGSLFTAGQEFSFDLGNLGFYYRLYADLMGHWQAVVPESVLLQMQYEELVQNPEREIERLLSHCGLPWEDGCLAFHKSPRPVRTVSAAQVRRPIYTSSITRWKNYAPYLQPLIEALGPHARDQN